MIVSCQLITAYHTQLRELGAEVFEALWGGDLTQVKLSKGRTGATVIRHSLTRLMKIIRSSGTPCCMSTSTAFIADPPVAGRKSFRRPRYNPRNA